MESKNALLFCIQTRITNTKILLLTIVEDDIVSKEERAFLEGSLHELETIKTIVEGVNG